MDILKNTQKRIIVQSDFHRLLSLVEINNDLFIQFGHRTYKLQNGELMEMCK